jgi:hypothetical protein
MDESTFLNEIASKETRAEEVANRVIEKPGLVPFLLKGFMMKPASYKFKSAKILVLISKDKPEILYPHFGFFAEQLDNENTILKWNALMVVANLTPVDSEKKFDKLFDKFYDLMKQGNLVTAANVVNHSPVIAKSKPYFEQSITQKILQIDRLELPTLECYNVLKGHAITAFDRYFEQVKNKREVIEFVKRELDNTRKAVKKKAEKFLKKWDK